jgi:hypothetical protein
MEDITFEMMAVRSPVSGEISRRHHRVDSYTTTRKENSLKMLSIGSLSVTKSVQ